MNFFFFNSSLISHLTVRENHKVIEMLTDLQTDDKNQLFIVKGQAVEDLLRSSENSVYVKVWKKYFHNDSRRLLNSINELEVKLLESEHNFRANHGQKEDLEMKLQVATWDLFKTTREAWVT